MHARHWRRSSYVAAASLSMALAACTPGEPTAFEVTPELAQPTSSNKPVDTGKPAGAVTVEAAAASVVPAGAVSVTATVTDKKGDPLANRTVTWSSSSGGSFSPQSGITDAAGHATAVFHAGTTAGPTTLTAASGGRSGAATITIEHGPAASIAAYSGNGGNQTAGTHRTISARITDSYGNAVPGYEVDWQVSDYPGDPGAVSISPGYSFTDANGIASADLSVGTSAGSLVAEASSLSESSVPLSGSAVRFTLTVVAAAPATVKVCPASNNTPDCFSAATISAALGSSLQFVVQSVHDAFGNPISGFSVTWGSSNPSLVTVNAGLAQVVGLVGDGNPNVDITAQVGTAVGRATLTLSASPGGPASKVPVKKPRP